MRRYVLAIAFIGLPSALVGAALAALLAPDTPAAQLARVEAAQSPSRQGLNHYTVPQLMERFNVPGVSIAVVNDYHVQSLKTYGLADVSTNAPVVPDTLFQAASISKPVTAFAVMRAVEAGR